MNLKRAIYKILFFGSALHYILTDSPVQGVTRNIVVVGSQNSKTVLEPENNYNISCSHSSRLEIVLSKPGLYRIDTLLCCHLSKIVFLKPSFEEFQMDIEKILVEHSSSLDVKEISKHFSFVSEIIKFSSQIVR